MTQIQSLQNMKNQLDQTELGLEAFADAQKFTVDEMIKQPQPNLNISNVSHKVPGVNMGAQE